MTTGEIRDLLLLGAIIGLALLFALRRGHFPAPLPPAVSPLHAPLDQEVRDLRHRIANVEQTGQQIPDHAARLRGVELEIREVRGALSGLASGQERIEHQLGMLLETQLNREERRPV